jgi:hypothetical protein
VSDRELSVLVGVAACEMLRQYDPDLLALLAGAVEAGRSAAEIRCSLEAVVEPEVARFLGCAALHLARMA